MPMKTRERSKRMIGAVAAGAIVAALLVLALIVRDRPGDGHHAPPPPPPVGAQAGKGTGVADATPGAATDVGAGLTPVELGDLDEKPWSYRDRAEQEAARRAAIERVRRSFPNAGAGVDPSGVQLSEVKPISGNGPESGRVSPEIAALPGPGELIVDGQRIAPSPPPAGLQVPPEAGGIRRPSSGPAPLQPQEPAGIGPVVSPPNPNAPGPGG